MYDVKRKRTEKNRMEEYNFSQVESLKNGFNNIKKKKLKFVFTVVFVVLTLFFISIRDTILHPGDAVIEKHAQLLVDKNEQFVQIEKYKFENGERDVNLQELTDDTVNQINLELKKMGKTGLNIYQLGNLHIPSNDIISYDNIYDMLEINPEFYVSNEPYTYRCDEVDIVKWDDFSNFFIEDIIGRTPSNYNEILISNYLAELLMTEGIKPYGENDYYNPTSYEELVNSNKYYYFGTADKVKIVGIINYDLSKYKSLDGISWDEYNLNSEKYSAISQELSYKGKNIYNKIFVNNDFINHLNVNDENTVDAIWQKKIVKTGVLVMENTKNGFEKLLHEFRYDEPIMTKSTYSEAVDIMMQFTNMFTTMPLLSNILFCIVIILMILSALLISKFVTSKQEVRELKNQKSKILCIKKMFLWNIIPISVISVILSSISLIFVPNFLMPTLMGEDNAILNPFILGTRQFGVLFLSMIGIGMISYLILKVRIKIAYKINK